LIVTAVEQSPSVQWHGYNHIRPHSKSHVPRWFITTLPVIMPCESTITPLIGQRGGQIATNKDLK
jgi:hypothetical protein